MKYKPNFEKTKDNLISFRDNLLSSQTIPSAESADSES